MFRSGIVVCCLLIPMTAVTSYAGDMDEQGVRTFIESIEHASANRNLEQLATVLADSVEIEITVIADGKSTTVTMNKEEYLISIQQSWAIWDDYGYRRSDLKVSLFDDRAEVTSIVHEQGSLQSATIRQSSADTSTVKLIDGRMLLTRIEGRVEL